MTKRVFLGPAEIAGYYAALQPGLEALGHRVLRVDLNEDWRRYAIGRQPLLARLALAARRRGLARRARGGAGRLWSKAEGVLRWALLLRAASACDTFVYAFGGTLTWHPRLELRLLRRLGRRVVLVYHGSDSRPPYLDTQILASDRGVSVADCAALTAEQKRKVLLLDSLADAVIDNPMSAHFHERSFVNWHAIGVPSAAPIAAGAPPAPDAPVPPDAPHAPHAPHAPVRILHCPSHPESKGTPLIRDAVERVRAWGRRVEYVEVIGQPHAVVLAELARCDFVVDQAFSDVPMAGFATEAAAFGRPAVVGGLAGAAFDEAIAPADRPPVLYCHPDELAEAIDRLVVDADYRRGVGAAAREFVRRHRDPRVVAERFARVLAGDVPPEWMFDPAEIRHPGGFGAPAVHRKAIRGLVDAYGESALQLDDKPALRRAVVAFAFAEEPLADAAPRVQPEPSL